jgi:hypothetical protein
LEVMAHIQFEIMARHVANLRYTVASINSRTEEAN